MKNTKPIAGYIRVSTDEQVKGTSLEDQKETVKAYCIFKGYQPDQIEWFEEEGFTGSLGNRPAYSRMKERILAGEFEMVIVKKTDRISRNLRELLTLIEDVIHPSGASYVDCEFNFDTRTPMGKMMLQMLGMFAEFERNQIKERMQSGRLRRAMEGRIATGELPYGYEKTEFGIEINEQQAEVVKLINKLSQEDTSYSAIARHLNGKGIPTKTGSKWYPQTVKNILTNKKYKGTLSQIVAGETVTSTNKHLSII